MSSLPLSHHEILGLIEPFTRCGLHVDLAASNRLTRTLCLPDGLQATLAALGSNPAQMLQHFDAVAPAYQFRFGPGLRIVRNYELEQDWRGVAADITLQPAPNGVDSGDLPEDLLAVLGWDWVRLLRTPSGWRSKLPLRGKKQRRSRAAEAGLERAAAHVVRTLAVPPLRFHERWALARWGVVFRRAIPVLTVLLLIGAIAALPHFTADRSPRTWTLLLHVPTMLIALSLCLQVQAQYEIPPLPRRIVAAAWRRTRS